MDDTATTVERSISTPQIETGGDGGLSRRAEADAANRASLERAYDAIEAREAEAEKQPVLHDQFRAEASADRVVKDHEDYYSQGLPRYESGTPVTVLDSLHAAASRAEARERAKEARRMPELAGEKTTRERLEASQKWSELADSDKVAFKAGHNEAKSQKEAAEWLGLTPEQAKLTEIEARLRDRDRVQPVLDRFQRLAPDKDPEATLAWHADVAEAFQRDPQGTIVGLAQKTGTLNALAEQVQRAAIEKGVAGMVDRFAAQVPDFEPLIPTMVEVLNRGLIRRTGHAVHDLKAAYAWARRYHGRA